MYKEIRSKRMKKQEREIKKTKIGIETRVKCALEEELLERSFRFIIPTQRPIFVSFSFSFSS